MPKVNHRGQGKGLLWRLEVPGQEAPSFLLGTMHTRDARVHALLQELEPHLAQCTVLATEFSFEDPGTTQDLVFQPSTDWWEDLTRRQKKQTVALTERLGLGDVASFRSLPPLILIQMITAELLGKEALEPMDIALATKGRALGMRLTGIETFEEQMELLHNMPIDGQRKQLADMVLHFSKFRRQLDKQVRWYLEQDIRKLYKDARKQLKGMRKPMLFRRNRIMAQRMAAMVVEGPHFLAVGAAHLAGGKGVLRLLKEKGFRLTAIPLGHGE